MYCAGTGNSYPTPCQAGSYSPWPGQSVCQPCPLSYVCGDAGMTAPALCPGGFICTGVGLTRPTAVCPPCFYCLAGTNSITPDLNITAAQRAVQLYNNVPVLGPFTCPAGAFCLGGVGSNIVNTTNFLNPQNCTAGFYCLAGSCRPEGSGQCPAGSSATPCSMCSFAARLFVLSRRLLLPDWHDSPAADAA